MTKIILAAAAAAALLTITPLVVKHPAQAQSVEVGPGGIRVDPDRRRDYYRDRRDYRGGRRCRTEFAAALASGLAGRALPRCDILPLHFAHDPMQQTGAEHFVPAKLRRHVPKEGIAVGYR